MIRTIAKALCLFGILSLDAIAAPDIQRWTLDNGARVYFVETHQIPMVQFAVGFDAGSARDPKALKGLARFVSDMIEEGAEGMDGETIALELESVGAQYSNGNGRDMSVFELRSLSEEQILESAVQVFANILQNPTFPANAMERIRDRMLVGLKQQLQSPGSVVSRAFYTNLFKNHPYSNPPSGEAEEVARIERGDLINFHRRYFVGANAVIAIVGDLNEKQARIWASKIVGGLPAGTAPDKLDDVSPSAQDDVLNISFPSSQTHMMIGQVGIRRNDPDYFPLYIGNYILGGSGLISRLSGEIREQRGLAYSVYSYFIPMQQNGPFIINLQTRNDNGALAEELVSQTVTEFVQRGPTQEELDAAKKNITGSFPLRINSNKKIADNLLSIAFYDLPLDYLETYSEKVNSVTLEQVKESFQRRVFPDRLLRVFVGGA
ncbi:MAG: pitrilysin family protein [Arenicellales bacterium]|nr:pitrilysin family protein [Arenicellales bacterium]